MSDLFVLSGQDEEVTPYDWDGMPEMIQKNKDVPFTVIVRFRNQEDLAEFAAKIEQPNLAAKGKRNMKACWYPPLEKGEGGSNSLLRWVDEE